MKSSLKISRLAALAWAAVAVVAVAAIAGVTPIPLHADDALFFAGAGLIVNRESLNAIYNGFKTAYANAFSGVEPSWKRVATLVPSTTKVENYGWLAEFPRLREWIGDRQIKSIAASGYQVTNKKFESSIGVSRDDIDDDTYGVLTPLFAEMGYAAATHPDELVFALLAAGFTTTCFDGQYFFDTDHPVGSGTVSNHGGGASTPWFLLDTSRPLKPLIFQKRRDYALKAMTDANDESVFMRDEYRYGVDARGNVGYGFWQMAFGSKQTLDATSYGAARVAMSSFKSDEGRPLGIAPNLLVVPPALEAAALQVVTAEKLANGADNIYRNTAKVLVVPWLA
ncbi:Mu-like prophage major head subunit gpT family protein [Rhodocyclus tenuis]|uniref:Phage major head subunit gpT-like protein n=1 Tax=Rhodocyclus tenuis TaxID=1066 RepID=A0A840G4D4_RHOTE|nr:Mu-like prophage major head subunit gpT family protein [Rhodocyclus tenuis]MBB4247253.1 phage major head subunit gpT-like protein [Rhodocyclus tenuis]